ncbi:hypothetical protein [Pistricoccus aurantiacus]|uniref:hypothetical protein n=1 Tax=Pistricoccus aurantiacus TaxID=1883414 RepID=UPI003634CE4A
MAGDKPNGPVYEKGYRRRQIQRLFVIIDWMIQLSHGLEPAFLQAVHAIEEDKKMPYINTAERHGIEKGLQQGLEEAEIRVQKAKRETARRMIMQTEMNDALIAELSGLAESEVVELRREMKR